MREAAEHVLSRYDLRVGLLLSVVVLNSAGALSKAQAELYGLLADVLASVSWIGMGFAVADLAVRHATRYPDLAGTPGPGASCLGPYHVSACVDF